MKTKTKNSFFYQYFRKLFSIILVVMFTVVSTVTYVPQVKAQQVHVVNSIASFISALGLAAYGDTISFVGAGTCVDGIYSLDAGVESFTIPPGVIVEGEVEPGCRTEFVSSIGAGGIVMFLGGNNALNDINFYIDSPVQIDTVIEANGDTNILNNNKIHGCYYTIGVDLANAGYDTLTNVDVSLCGNTPVSNKAIKPAHFTTITDSDLNFEPSHEVQEETSTFLDLKFSSNSHEITNLTADGTYGGGNVKVINKGQGEGLTVNGLTATSVDVVMDTYNVSDVSVASLAATKVNIGLKGDGGDTYTVSNTTVSDCDTCLNLHVPVLNGHATVDKPNHIALSVADYTSEGGFTMTLGDVVAGATLVNRSSDSYSDIKDLVGSEDDITLTYHTSGKYPGPTNLGADEYAVIKIGYSDKVTDDYVEEDVITLYPTDLTEDYTFSKDVPYANLNATVDDYDMTVFYFRDEIYRTVVGGDDELVARNDGINLVVSGDKVAIKTQTGNESVRYSINNVASMMQYPNNVTEIVWDDSLCAPGTDCPFEYEMTMHLNQDNVKWSNNGISESPVPFNIQLVATNEDEKLYAGADTTGDYIELSNMEFVGNDNVRTGVTALGGSHLNISKVKITGTEWEAFDHSYGTNVSISDSELGGGTTTANSSSLINFYESNDVNLSNNTFTCTNKATCLVVENGDDITDNGSSYTGADWNAIEFREYTSNVAYTNTTVADAGNVAFYTDETSNNNSVSESKLLNNTNGAVFIEEGGEFYLSTTEEAAGNGTDVDSYVVFAGNTSQPYDSIVHAPLTGQDPANSQIVVQVYDENFNPPINADQMYAEVYVGTTSYFPGYYSGLTPVQLDANGRAEFLGVDFNEFDNLLVAKGHDPAQKVIVVIVKVPGELKIGILSALLQAIPYGSNTAPVANPDSYYLTNDYSSLNITSVGDGPLGNDFDQELDPLTITDYLADPSCNGTFVMDPAGPFTYTPNVGVTTATCVVTYTVSDGQAVDYGTITIEYMSPPSTTVTSATEFMNALTTAYNQSLKGSQTTHIIVIGVSNLTLQNSFYMVPGLIITIPNDATGDVTVTLDGTPTTCLTGFVCADSISDFSIEGVNPRLIFVAGENVDNVFDFNNTENAYLYHVEARDSLVNGLNIENSQNNVIDDFVISDITDFYGSSGIAGINENNGTNNQFSNITTDGGDQTDHGIRSTNSNGTSLSNVTISNPSREGLWTEYVTGLVGVHLTVEGDIEFRYSSGFDLDDLDISNASYALYLYNLDNSSISNATIDNSDYGLYVAFDSDNNVFDGFNITNSNTRGGRDFSSNDLNTYNNFTINGAPEGWYYNGNDSSFNNFDILNVTGDAFVTSTYGDGLDFNSGNISTAGTYGFELYDEESNIRPTSVVGTTQAVYVGGTPTFATPVITSAVTCGEPNSSIEVTADATATQLEVYGFQGATANPAGDLGTKIATAPISGGTATVNFPTIVGPSRVTVIAYNGEGDAATITSQPSNSVEFNCTGDIDFGDAPDSYKTLLASNGARHTITTLTLGPTIDSEIDGQPVDLDGGDEDGVTFTSYLDVNSTATVEVVASEAGLLDAWVDFNGDGGFAETGDQIFASESLTAGTNSLSFTVPATATNLTNTWARFRLSTAGGLSYTGAAADGEVEDYPVFIGQNSLPTPQNNSYVTLPGQQLNISAPGVLADDTDPDGDVLTAIPIVNEVGVTCNGTLNLNADGSFTYDPGASGTCVETFTYYVTDGISGQASATITITITTAPIAYDDAYTTDSSTNITLGEYNVLDNDSEGSAAANLDDWTMTGDAGWIVDTSAAYEGVNGAKNQDIGHSQKACMEKSITMTSGGNSSHWWNVSSEEDYDFLEYHVDGIKVAEISGSPGWAEFIYYLTAGNHIIKFCYDKDSSVDGGADEGYIDLWQYDGNIENFEGGEAVLTVVDTGTQTGNCGVINKQSDGTFTYTVNGSTCSNDPSADFGPDTFTYTANNGFADSNQATITITVNPTGPGNLPPVAHDDSYSTPEDTTLNVAAAGVLINDTDPEGDPLTAVLDTTTTHGALTLNADGSFEYIPDTSYVGSDSFTYFANDGTSNSIAGTVTINVGTINEAPVAADDTYSTPEDTALNIAAAGVLTNDTDANGDALTSVLVADVTHGSLALNTDGSFTYSPDSDYFGPDSFTYKANDGVLDSNTATVNISVTSVNDVPVATDDAYSTDEDVILNVAAPGLLTNDTDTEGDTLTPVLVTNASHGNVLLSADGGFQYTPDLNYNGTDSFTYKVNDGSDDSNVATVTLTINAVNDAPTMYNDVYVTAEDTELVIVAPGVLDNDYDVDGDTITAVLDHTVQNGTLTLNVDGSFTYTPNENFNGDDQFTYTAFDGTAHSIIATVFITVTEVNDAPYTTSLPPSATADEDALYTFNYSAEDPDGDDLTITATVLPLGANFTDHGNGTATITWTPGQLDVGVHNVELTISDGTTSITYSFTITVVNVNDAPVAVADGYSTNEDTLLTVAAAGVLGNDTDEDGDSITAVLDTTTTNGTLTLNADGSFTYNPNVGYNGSDSFTYHATDGTLDSNIVTVTITVGAVNDAPVAADDSFSTAEDTALSIAATGVLTNDIDPDGDAITAVLVAGPSNGSVTLNNDGSFTYTPNADFNGTDTFTYQANDGLENSNVATVTVTVTAVNDAPVAALDTYSVAEDTTLNVAAAGVLLNDNDVDGDALTAALVTDVSSGVLSLNTDGSFQYIPNADFNGTDSFTYKASDGTLDSNTVTVTITVTPVNDAPVAQDDSYVVDEDTDLSVIAPGPLGNDTDPEGDVLTAILVSAPTNGSVTLNNDGSFTYTPNADYNGPDSFTYKANDGGLDSNVVTVSITVAPVNDAPVAQDDAYGTDEDTTLSVVAPGVLANDTDTEGDSMIASLVSTVSNGTLTLNADGSFDYTPNADFNGTDSFTYLADDGTDVSDAATVTITVNAVNDAPVAYADTYSTDEDVTLNVLIPGVLTNDSDAENDALAAVLVTPPSNGTLTLNADGSFTYTPNANFNGTDSFTYKANDGSLDSNVVTVTITVNSVNDAPVINTVVSANTTEEDVPYVQVITAIDADGDSLVMSALSPFPTWLTATDNGNGSMTIEGTPGQADVDSYTITVTASDGTDQDVYSYPLEVLEVNEAPVANNDSYTTDEDVALTVASPGLTANDTDEENDTITAVKVTDPANGSVVIEAGGGFTYTPNPGFNGNDSFTYKVTDGVLESNIATVTINVGAVNDAPVAVNDAYSTDEDTALTIAASGVMDNDYDPDGDTINAVLVSGTTNGAVTLNSNGSFTYTPDENFNGTDTFTYQVSDGTEDSNVATVTITVNAVNDAAVAVTDSYTTDEDVTLNVLAPGVLGNDTDVDGDSLSATYVSGPSNGTLTLNADGSFTYVPNADFNGTDSFTYMAWDGTVDSNVVTVTITVNPINDAPVAVADSYTTNEDVALTIAAAGILDNDTDPEGDALTAILVSNVSNGTLALNGDGSFTYTPDLNFHGTDSFEYKANDGTDDSNTVTVTITVTSVNDAPVAQDDAYETDEDTTLTVAAPGVNANDSDADGDALVTGLVTDVSNGTLILNSDGSFTYTPDENFNGTDSFTYKVNDGTDDSNTVTVTITVHPVNDAPVGADDSYTTAEDTALSIAAPGVITNDSDVDGDALTAILVDLPSNGFVTLLSDGSFTYTPNEGTVNSGVITVNITVTPVNDAPVAVADAYSTTEDVALSVPAPGVLDNDSDVDGDALTAQLISSTSNGTLTLNTDGSFTYTPDAGYFGTDSFTYVANDGSVDSNVVTVTIEIGAENDVPVAVDDNYTTNEDTPVTMAVLQNDTDADGDSLTASLVSQPSNGAVTLNGDNTFTYTPNENFNGTDSFQYQAYDGIEYSNIATVTITVNPVNDAPVALADAYSTNEDVTLTVVAPGVMANDYDVDGDTLTAQLVAPAINGTVTLNGDGSFEYIPNANYYGTDSFTYKVNDGVEDSGIVTVTLTVVPVNDAPVAADDAYTTAEDMALHASAPGVLGNDSDIDGDALSAVLVAGPSNGTLVLHADGSFDYTPNTDYNGTDTFTYKASDSNLESGVATVTITVTPVNDAPVAYADAYATDEDITLTIAAAGVLANDTDAEGDALSAVLVSGPSNGTLTLNSDGSFEYVPNANYFGTDGFTYQASDGSDSSNIVAVTITVNPVNDAPVANDDMYSMVEDTTLTVAIPGVLDNDADVDGDTLSAVLQTNVTSGTLALNANGSFTYTPNAGYFGTDSFTYVANDGSANSNVATVTINIGAENDAPIALDDAYTTNEDTTLTVPGPGVLGNDTDEENDPLSAILASGPSHGALTLNSDGSFEYIPDANYYGEDSFTYEASDSQDTSNIATVTITVTSVNDVPVAQPDAYSVLEDEVLNVVAPGVLGNDSDADADILNAVIVTAPANGSLVLNPNGSFTYTPNADFNGTDTFTYHASDGSANSNAVTVTITVESVNDAPVAVSDTYSVEEDTQLTVPAPGVLGNDSDVEGDPLTAVQVSTTTHGSLSFNADGSFIYTPAPNYNGPDSFSYMANDGVDNSPVTTVDITVTPVNDAPVAVDDTYTTNEDSTLTIGAPGVMVNDTDVDGDTLTASVVSDVTHGSITLSANGSITYTPDADYYGPDSFTYKVNDGTVDSNVATVNITVNAVNDDPVAYDDSYTMNENGVLNTPAPGVLDNDTDAEGDNLNAVLVSDVSNGDLTLNADGSFIYTPAPGYSGTDTFTYTANDGFGTSQFTANAASNVAVVTITIMAVNDAPVANNDSYTMSQDTTLTIAVPGVLGNDTDPEGDVLTAILVGSPTSGTLSFNADGSFSYTPNAGYTGSDSFTYKANDGQYDSNVAMVTIVINASSGDADGDGILDEDDHCPQTFGYADRKGCPYAIEPNVQIHIVDQLKSGVCMKDGKVKGSCKKPLVNVEVRVFDRDDPDFSSTYGRSPKGNVYDTIYESQVGQKGSCSTVSDGKCIAGVAGTAEYLIIVKYYDSETGQTAYTGKNVKIDNNDDIKGKKLKIMKVYKKKNGLIYLKSAGKTEIVGSILEIVYPDDLTWNNADELYPFQFLTDSTWELDVCASVPEGYDIVGVLDDEGNLITTDECMQTLVANEIKSVVFEVVEVGSPEPDVTFSFDVARKMEGKDFTQSGEFKPQVKKTFDINVNGLRRPAVKKLKVGIRDNAQKTADKLEGELQILEKKLVGANDILQKHTFAKMEEVQERLSKIQKTIKLLENVENEPDIIEDEDLDKQPPVMPEVPEIEDDTDDELPTEEVEKPKKEKKEEPKKENKGWLKEVDGDRYPTPKNMDDFMDNRGKMRQNFENSLFDQEEEVPEEEMTLGAFIQSILERAIASMFL